MKKLMNSTMVLSLLVLARPAYSAPDVSACDEAHPCLGIVDRCKEAGFYRGGFKEKKGLFKDCLKPTLRGKAVSQVSVDPSLVAACKAKLASRRGD